MEQERQEIGNPFFSLPLKKRRRIIKPSSKTNAQKSMEQEIQEMPGKDIRNRDTK